jgi:hypothetical protein
MRSYEVVVEAHDVSEYVKMHNMSIEQSNLMRIFSTEIVSRS